MATTDQTTSPDRDVHTGAIYLIGESGAPLGYPSDYVGPVNYRLIGGWIAFQEVAKEGAKVHVLPASAVRYIEPTPLPGVSIENF